MANNAKDLPLNLAALANADPVATIEAIYDRIAAAGDDGVWINRVSRADALERACAVRNMPPGPLRGVPFAVKDNIDVAGLPTTAACPDFAYTAERSATAVRRLEAAGAIVIGKTNLDQFATGLVGTRTPYGVSRNPFDARYIPGGSSSGSAVAVATGLVSFALGTDTAGFGRVPAGFNNIVGLKPTRGLISCAGVVPACRSLDCVSVFALTVEDAATVMAAAGGPDAADPFSREITPRPALASGNLRVGVPAEADLVFDGDPLAAAAFDDAVARLSALGTSVERFDMAPFRETAALLYSGPWVAERLAVVAEFLAKSPDSFHPITRQIIEGGARFSAVDTFRALYRLEELRRQAGTVWQGFDVLMMPTSPTIYTLAQIAAEPIRHNSMLGTYTNFVNLLDLCALAVPNGMRPDGLPTGITFLAPADSDALLTRLGKTFHGAVGGAMGATGIALDDAPADDGTVSEAGSVSLAVVGAHLSGEPLNPHLLRLGARLARCCATSPEYRLYALAEAGPLARPGMLRDDTGGAPIEVEVWSLSEAAFGSLVAKVPPPLCIGTVTLEDGATVRGFLCEPHGIQGAEEITRFGGWRAFRRANGTVPSV